MRISTIFVLAITAIGCSAYPTVDNEGTLVARDPQLQRRPPPDPCRNSGRGGSIIKGCPIQCIGDCNEIVWLPLISTLYHSQLTFSSAKPGAWLDIALSLGKLNQP
jgi:hypothetical protein